MTLRKAVLWQLGAFALSCVASAIYAFRLPDRVPIHWGLNGQPDGWGSKWTNLLMFPGMLLVFVVLTVVLPMISPKGFRIESFSGTYGYIMALVSWMFFAIHLVVLQASVGSDFDTGRVLIAIIFLFFALMGNVLGRVKRNFWVGIRTPWTLADERVWKETHRAAGKLWFVGGLIGAAMATAGMPPAGLFTYLMFIALLPVYQSYKFYRRLT